VFFVLVGFFGLIVHLSSFNNNDPCLAGCHNGCYGWGIVELPASIEACFAFAVIFVIIFVILGVAYSFLAATLAIQRIWQRHYHILTKKELTKASLLKVNLREKESRILLLISRSNISLFDDAQEYVVEDLPGGYTPPKMDPEHEQRLKMLQLM